MRNISKLIVGVLCGSLCSFAAPASAQSENQLVPVAIAELEITTEATETTPAIVTLDGSDSFDPDTGGGIASYQWEVLTEAYQWIELNQQSPASPTATFEVPPTKLIQRFGWILEFRLTVADRGRPAATDSDQVTLRINRPPVANIDVTAKLFDRDDQEGVDDNRNGMVDENEERYTIEGVVSGPWENRNAGTEWHIRAATLLVLDGSASFDPDGELTDESFRWERLHTRGASSVTASLPGDAEGQKMLSTDEDPRSPGSQSSETVARLPFVSGVGTAPYIVFYRLTVTDEQGTSASQIAQIRIFDFHDDPEVEIAFPESDPDGATTTEKREGVLAAGENRYVVSPTAAEEGIELVATGEADGAGRTRALIHTWSGTGVVPAQSNRPGAMSRAEFKAPPDTEEGAVFPVQVQVTDPGGRRTVFTVELVVADTSAPTATAPTDIDTPDGADGGFPESDPPTGVVQLRGIGFDPDGDDLAYRWEQVLNESGDELGRRFRGSRLLLTGADTPDASFRLPEVVRGEAEMVYVQLTVTDRWGVAATDVVKITMRDGADDLQARAGADQAVAPGSLVRLAGGFSSWLVSRDAIERVAYQWAYKGLQTHPRIDQRPSMSRSEQAQGFAAGEWLADAQGVYHPTAGGRLKNADRFFAYFDAPELSDFNSVTLVLELTVRYDPNPDNNDDTDVQTHTDAVVVTVADRSGSGFFSGVVSGPDYCAARSLGGLATFPFDSDRDGVADVCALQRTRRAAVAHQQALAMLATLHPQAFAQALFGRSDNPDTDADESSAGTCEAAPTDLGDTDEALTDDICGRAERGLRNGELVPVAPEPVDAVRSLLFYSDVIDHSQFCINHSLGGPTTYPFDSDEDGVADTCALPYTRRAGVARRNALAAAFEDHPQYPAALAAACAALGTLDFGDTPEALAQDSCSKPPHPPAVGPPPPAPPPGGRKPAGESGCV
ncbi:MAG: hypothetical protein OXF04_05970, partial [bacterium]|nr:hypothetical protein [bacterium]